MNEPSKQHEPHIIRLRGPWQRTVLCDEREDTSNDAKMTVRMPVSWGNDLGEDFRGKVRYRRMFNRPTGIDELTDIRLRFERLVGNAVILLNQKQLGAIQWPDVTGQFAINGLLEPRNQLDVEIEAVACSVEKLAGETNEATCWEPGLVGEVRLEIG